MNNVFEAQLFFVTATHSVSEQRVSTLICGQPCNSSTQRSLQMLLRCATLLPPLGVGLCRHYVVTALKGIKVACGGFVSRCALQPLVRKTQEPLRPVCTEGSFSCFVCQLVTCSRALAGVHNGNQIKACKECFAACIIRGSQLCTQQCTPVKQNLKKPVHYVPFIGSFV